MVTYANRSLERGATILDCLGEARHPMSLTEIAASTALNTATLYRLLEVLSELEYVHRNQKTGRYTIGYRIYRIGRSTRQLESLARDARPFLLRLSHGLNETALLGALDGQQVVYYDKVEPWRGLKLNTVGPGVRLKAHATALGKAMLALIPDPEVVALYRGQPLLVNTKNTITDIGTLLRELAKVRQQGYALDEGETTVNHHCVAVPIRNSLGLATMAISICRPGTRRGDPPREVVARYIQKCASDIVAFRAPKLHAQRIAENPLLCEPVGDSFDA